MDTAEIPKTGRRGRPRKYPIDTAKPIKTVSSTTPTPTTPTVYEEKPREERSYKDFFPDLNIKEPLAIVKINKIDAISPTTTTESDAAPSNDEYETASEGEMENKRSRLPLASFHKISAGSDSAHDESEEESEPLSSNAFIRPANHYIRYIGTEKRKRLILEFAL